MRTQILLCLIFTLFMYSRCRQIALSQLGFYLCVPQAETTPHVYRTVFILLFTYYLLLGLPAAFILVMLLCFPFIVQFIRFAAGRTPRQLRGASPEEVSKLASEKFEPDDTPEEDRSCVICLSDYDVGDTLRILPCQVRGQIPKQGVLGPHKS